jgi:RNA polymerase sigma-70 factor (ECF subfamily)
MNDQTLDQTEEATAQTVQAAEDNLAKPIAAHGEISRLTEHLFRHEAGKLVSILTGIFGIERLHLAEDVVQEALVRAFQTWPYYGIPKNPAAWLTQTAKNLTLDLIRREKLFRDKQEQIVPVVEQWGSGALTEHSAGLDNEIKDDTLRLMFACCHPLVPQDAQAALALKTLCGFSPLEIAKAFLTSEAAIAKRLVRARQKIREQHIPFEIPSGAELSARLEGVLQALYLLFNEGYKASSGDALVRADLCSEAIRLTSLLGEHPVGNQPRTHALLALMLLNAARLPARVDAEGNMLRLSEQDRAHWNRGMIARGMMHMARSAAGEEITTYHLQAGIAACHCSAPDAASTDWAQILDLYDRLIQVDDSPVAALNRAVALGYVHGPEAAVEAVQRLQQGRLLNSYHLLYAVLAEFEAQLSNFQAAANHLRKAIELTEIKSERTFLSKRLQDCEDRLSR